MASLRDDFFNIEKGLRRTGMVQTIKMCDIILEFLYTSINANFDIPIYHFTDLSTYIENWIFYLPFLLILSNLLLFKSFCSRYGISSRSS